MASDHSTHTRSRSSVPERNRDDTRQAALRWEVGQTIAREFVIEGILGKGGMGEVFLMRRIVDDRLFAVKTLRTHLLKHTRDRKQFLNELQTWIDLPEHPHLAVCRFFRTFTDRLAIFTDPIDGGSLSQWITDHRIRDLEQVFDIAIQMAWGLHAAHVCGVIHQDVKPANVLMTRDGVAKITDFGLSRTQRREIHSRQALIPGPHLVSTAGMTPAYCSPEQAVGDRLSHKTDIWSWAVSVIELLAGRMTWTLGVVAPAVLDSLRSSRSRFAESIPNRLLEILEQALQFNPDDRWSGFDAVSDALITACGVAFSKPYTRTCPVVSPRTGSISARDSRWRSSGVPWRDPAEVLKELQIKTGETLVDADADERSDSSHTNQALTDLTMFRDALDFTDRMMTTGMDLRYEKMLILGDLAFIHEELGDLPGCLDLIDQKIEIIRAMLSLNERSDLILCLSRSYMNKANVLSDAGHLTESLPLYHQAAELSRMPAAASSAGEVFINRAKSYTNVARVYWKLNRSAESESNYVQAIQEWKSIFKAKPTPENAHGLAVTYMNFAVLLTEISERFPEIHRLLNAALKCYNSFEPSVALPDFPFHISRVYLAKSNLFFTEERYEQALTYIDRCMIIRERLVFKEGRRNLAPGLATTFMNKSSILWKLNRIPQALDMIDRCIDLRSRLVFDENRSEIQLPLVEAIIEKAFILFHSAEMDAAASIFQSAHNLAIRFKHQPSDEKRFDPMLAESMLAIIGIADPGRDRWPDEDVRTAALILETDTIRIEKARNELIIQAAFRRRSLT